MTCTLLNSQAKPVWYTSGGDKDYLRIPIRMHIHFNSIIAPVNEGLAYNGSVYAPYAFTAIRPKVIDAITFNVEHTFFVKGKNCLECDYNTYVEDNLHKFTEHAIWQVKKEQLIKQYLDMIYRTCGVNISPESLDYSVQFCWRNVTQTLSA